jgi:predicted Rossmann-fold nucleotide-binding protein
MDELFEALTLAQTGTIRHYPVALVGQQYWGGLIDWLRARMLEDGNIGERDLGLINICETPEDVLELVRAEGAALRSLTAW